MLQERIDGGELRRQESGVPCVPRDILSHSSASSSASIAWWFARFDPNLDSIRDHPEFQTMMAELEADMAAQRAELETEGLMTAVGA